MMDGSKKNLLFVSSSGSIYKIYALDVSLATSDYDSKGIARYPLPDPILSFTADGEEGEGGYPMDMSFGSLGSKLYMLGGVNIDRDSSTADSYTRRFSIKPSRSVYVVDTNDDDDKLCITQGPTLNAPKSYPLVIPLGNKLYVMSNSLCPDSDNGHLIEVLDPKEGSWTPINLPPNLVQVAEYLLETDENYCRRGYDPYIIETYATNNNTITLSLSMSRTHDVGVLVLNTETNSWLSGCTKSPVLRGRLLYDNFCCPTDSSRRVLIFQQGDELDFVEIPPGVLYKYSRIMELDDEGNKLLAFSWTCSDDDINEGYLAHYFRLDILNKWRSTVTYWFFDQAVMYQLIKFGIPPPSVHYCFLTS